MKYVIKATSLGVFAMMFSACNQTNVSSSETSDPTQMNAPSDETSSKNGEVKSIKTEKAEGAEIRSAESHTHGDASVAMVLDGSMITVELDTPLYNLLGFEHEADTPAQKAIVLKAETVLARGGPLFIFNSEAGCMISQDKISVELERHEDEDEHGEHKDAHDKSDTHDETHKDVIVQYEYMCQSPKALKNVTVNLFDHFENLTELDLVYLGPNTQKQSELSAEKSRMNLTR